MPLTARRALALLGLVLCLAACKDEKTPSRPGGKAAGGASAAPARAGTVELVLLYGSEKKTWLEEQIKRFEAGQPRTKSGKPIHIDARGMGSGEATQAILSGAVKPHVYSPASGAYAALLNDAWLSRPEAGTGVRPLAPAGDPLVLSPIVVVLWKPMAEALGWPGKPIGWSDFIRVAADPKGWGAYGHPEWGAFKLGHTHPEFSNSGLLAVLAEAYAGAKKTRAISAADLDAPATRAFLAKVEDTIVHYGKSTGFFAEKMLGRGPSYLSAAVLYENLVIESYGKETPGAFPLVAVYPTEGTFWSDHPYCILDAEWVGADEKDAAQQLLAFLKDRPAQQRALELGFRPADPSIAIGAPIDRAHGVDAKEPQTLLEVPDARTLAHLVEVWREQKKSTDIVLVFDMSGSMRGKPLDDAKLGAKAFVDRLEPRDQLSLIFFNHTVFPAYGPVEVGKEREGLRKRIDEIIAQGGTALYDAVAEAYDAALARARKQPGRIHALVVMTDGQDTNSKTTLEQLGKRFDREESPVKVFTIAYGAQADPGVLGTIAEAAQGSFVKGSAETIVQVYEDVAAFF